MFNENQEKNKVELGALSEKLSTKERDLGIKEETILIKERKLEEEHAKAEVEKQKFDARKARFDSGIVAMTNKQWCSKDVCYGVAHGFGTVLGFCME